LPFLSFILDDAVGIVSRPWMRFRGGGGGMEGAYGLVCFMLGRKRRRLMIRNRK
jgi:hypothetical protein